jgi:hypothetical protein
MVIFALSFWSITYSIAKIRSEVLSSAEVPRVIRKVSAGFSLLIALVFFILWIIQLLPLIQSGEKIEFLYSIYILDLCFIMPAFAIIGIMALRKVELGLILIPAMFILGFTLIFSLTISELVKPVNGLNISIEGLVQSLILSLLFLILVIPYLRQLRLDYDFNGNP